MDGIEEEAETENKNNKLRRRRPMTQSKYKARLPRDSGDRRGSPNHGDAFCKCGYKDVFTNGPLSVNPPPPGFQLS